MEHSSKKIISLQLVNKLQTDNISNNMEYAGFTEAVRELSRMKLDIAEIVTDCHTEITGNLRKYSVGMLSILYNCIFGIQFGVWFVLYIIVLITDNHPGIIHSHDIWHAAKNLTKKLNKVKYA